MTQTNPDHPTFNLWAEPWITVERPDGTRDALNIPQTIIQAHQIRALYDPSPLVTVSIHRLLLAILQEVIAPKTPNDLKRVWQARQFTAEQLQPFAEKYAHRFDLFSLTVPFLQSADLPLQPQKKADSKPISYLIPEEPAGTGVTHYTHAYDNHQRLCSACAAKGLLMIPAFASSGGAGIKPSINGVPPIYVIPGGETLFESLTASLTMPQFQPKIKAKDDVPWWKHDPVIAKKGELQHVGYLQSLTFPARRTRLHPVLAEQQPCTRCGQITPWHVATMIYEMGESRPKNAPWWRDPFAAYRPPKNEKDTKDPTPIRPVEGRALWREFNGFILPSHKDYRPAILSQLEEVSEVLPYNKNTRIPLRLVGIRTDMKMKIFEWQESGFAVPPRLLTDMDSAEFIEKELEFAKQCDGTIKSTFRQYFGGGGKTKRFESVTTQMSRQYWQELGLAFHTHIQQYTAEADGQKLFEDWLNQVVNKAKEVFEKAVESVPVEGYLKKPDAVKDYRSIKRSQLSKLRLQQEAIDECHKWLYIARKKLLSPEEVK